MSQHGCYVGWKIWKLTLKWWATSDNDSLTISKYLSLNEYC